MGAHTSVTPSVPPTATPTVTPATPASSPYVTQAMEGIRRLVRVLRTGTVEAERQTGLSSAQLYVLQQLTEIDGPSINELAGRTLTDQSSVSTLVSRLEAKHLVTRTPSPTDARRVVVRITKKGRAVLDRTPPVIQHRLVRVLQELPEASLQAFSHEITQLVARLGAAHEPPMFFFEDDATSSR